MINITFIIHFNGLISKNRRLKMKLHFIKRMSLFVLLSLTLIVCSCAAFFPIENETSKNSSENMESEMSISDDSESTTNNDVPKDEENGDLPPSGETSDENETSDKNEANDKDETNGGNETSGDSSTQTPSGSDETEKDSANGGKTDIELPEVVLP